MPANPSERNKQPRDATAFCDLDARCLESEETRSCSGLTVTEPLVISWEIVVACGGLGEPGSSGLWLTESCSLSFSSTRNFSIGTSSVAVADPRAVQGSAQLGELLRTNDDLRLEDGILDTKNSGDILANASRNVKLRPVDAVRWLEWFATGVEGLCVGVAP